MNWHANGRASMPCDAPISVDLNIRTPPTSSPSLLPLMHQHRLKLVMARLLLNLSRDSGPKNPLSGRRRRTVEFPFALGGPRILRRCHDGNQGNFKGGHTRVYTTRTHTYTYTKTQYTHNYTYTHVQHYIHNSDHGKRKKGKNEKKNQQTCPL